MLLYDRDSDFVRIYEDDDSCTKVTKDTGTFTSQGNLLRIRFVSDFTFEERGFLARYTIF